LSRVSPPERRASKFQGGARADDLEIYFSALGVNPLPTVTLFSVDGAVNNPTGDLKTDLEEFDGYHMHARLDRSDVRLLTRTGLTGPANIRRSPQRRASGSTPPGGPLAA
jgi:hypothetical protein